MGVKIVEGKVQFGGCEASHCNQWGLCGVFSTVRGGDRDKALPKLLWDFLLSADTRNLIYMSNNKPVHTATLYGMPASNCHMYRVLDD